MLRPQLQSVPVAQTLENPNQGKPKQAGVLAELRPALFSFPYRTEILSGKQKQVHSGRQTCGCADPPVMR